MLDEKTKKSEYINAGMSTKEMMVYNKVKEAILNNEFEPGTVLVERKLSEKYNVSRSPVRYALRQLAKEGLLADEPGRVSLFPPIRWKTFWKYTTFWKCSRYTRSRYL